MARIHDGGPASFNAAIYGMPHPGTQQFLQQGIESMSLSLNEAGQRFMAGTREIYERVNGSHAMRMLRASGRKLKSIWQSDSIRALVTIGETQHAPLSMQRYIMAEPEVRKLYHQQRCDGYSGSYIDQEPGLIGEAHYDYRRVTNGMFIEQPNGDLVAVTYFEELHEGDRELLLEEAVDIFELTWNTVRNAIRAGGEDPVSKYNAEL